MQQHKSASDRYIEEREAECRMLGDRDLQINISFSVKDGHKICEREKSYLDMRNRSIQTILDQRQYALDGYIATKQEQYWRFICLCDEQLLKILGMPLIEKQKENELTFPLKPNDDSILAQQIAFIAQTRAQMLESFKIHQEYSNDSKPTVVPTVNANINEC